jgi:hypothetical protein
MARHDAPEAEGTAPSDGAASPGATPPASPVGVAVDAVCFLGELGMLVILAIGGWSLGNGGLLGICMAVLYPALAILVWAVWLAPRSQDRLDDPARFVVQVLLFGATGTVSALAGHLLIGVGFAVLAVAGFAASRVFER